MVNGGFDVNVKRAILIDSAIGNVSFALGLDDENGIREDRLSHFTLLFSNRRVIMTITGTFSYQIMR
jgi:hypothetical protein